MAYRIDGSSAVTSKPTRGAAGPNPDSYFQDTDSGGGTRVSADWLNMTQDEFATLVENSGLTLSKADDTQVYQALVKYLQGTSTAIVNPFANYALFADTKTTGTTGQVATDGVFVKRNLVEIENNIVGMSIASDVITLPAGTYRFKGYGVAGCNGDNTAHTSIVGLFDGDSANVVDLLLSGSSASIKADVLQSTNIISNIEGKIQFASSATLTFRQYVHATGGSAPGDKNLGFPVSVTGVSEKYSALEIWKLD